MRADGSTAWCPRPLAPLWRGCWLLAALSLVAVTACGTGSGDGDQGSGVSAGEPGDAPADPGEPVTAELTITARLDDGAEDRRVVLTCPADGAGEVLWPGGAVRVQACASLADPDVLDALRPPPADQVCTEIYGGPEVATITGTVAGTPVDAQVDRTNGCGIARWDVLAPILPPLGR